MSAAAVILAAGQSTRMGLPNKLLMQVGGDPLLRRVIAATLPVVDTPPLVVLGHEAGPIAAVIAGLPVTTIENPAFAQGQEGSVRLGLCNAPQADVTLVILGDQPFLTADDLAALLAAHHASSGDRITVPVRGEARGNPVAIPSALRDDLLAGGARLGCGAFTRENPDLVHPFETDRRGFFFDIDTQDDLERARDAAHPTGAA